jgi:hypothetical protein
MQIVAIKQQKNRCICHLVVVGKRDKCLYKLHSANLIIGLTIGGCHDRSDLARQVRERESGST